MKNEGFSQTKERSVVALCHVLKNKVSDLSTFFIFLSEILRCSKTRCLLNVPKQPCLNSAKMNHRMFALDAYDGRITVLFKSSAKVFKWSHEKWEAYKCLQHYVSLSLLALLSPKRASSHCVKKINSNFSCPAFSKFYICTDPIRHLLRPVVSRTRVYKEARSVCFSEQVRGCNFGKYHSPLTESTEVAVKNYPFFILVLLFSTKLLSKGRSAWH